MLKKLRTKEEESGAVHTDAQHQSIKE